jgi:hypothetical protein
MYCPTSEYVDSKNENLNGTNLLPILPTFVRDARYQGDARVELNSTIISLGAHFCSAPSYRSQGWTVSVHPEGKRYSHNDMEDGISFVTEAYVTDPVVAEKLEGCIAMIRGLAAKENLQLQETTDLFLEYDHDLGNCSYWFADHAHRTVFWLHEVDTSLVGLPDSYSKRHLQYALEENYWIHVEMFPATASQYSMTALNELYIIFLNARADALTSDIPTFPYTAKECERFINLLQSSKVTEHASNPYITTFVARLWVVVANHRFFSHFGEDHCRMSCIHSVVEAPAGKRGLVQGLVLKAISKALFDLPTEHRERLEMLWVDDLVYSSAWRKHVSERVEDLVQKMTWIFALTIANILIIPISYCPALNNSSIILCILGLCITLVLYQEQRKLVDTGSSAGAAYLDTHNTSYGFEPTAIVHSLPLATFVWAFFLFAIQGFWMTFGDLPVRILLPTIISVAVVLALVCFGVYVALHPREKPFEATPFPASVPLQIQISSMEPKDPSAVDGMV